MNSRDPKLTALLFNDRINRRDLEGLVTPMILDHSWLRGGEADTCDLDSGRGTRAYFFETHPDYATHFSVVRSRGNLVTKACRSEASHEESLDGPNLQSALSRGDLVRSNGSARTRRRAEEDLVCAADMSIPSQQQIRTAAENARWRGVQHLWLTFGVDDENSQGIDQHPTAETPAARRGSGFSGGVDATSPYLRAHGTRRVRP